MVNNCGNKVKPEDNGECECESWREVAYSRSESRRTVFYTLTGSYLRHEPVSHKLTKQKPEMPFNQDAGVVSLLPEKPKYENLEEQRRFSWRQSS